MPTYARNLFIAAVSVLGFSSSAFPQTAPENFIAVTPCRLADTRVAYGGSGPVTGGTYKTFQVVGAGGVDGGPACNIPSNANAYSLNVTAVPPSGHALNYLSVLPATSPVPTTAPSSSTLNDASGMIIANAAIVPSGVNGAVMVYPSNTSDVILDIDGYFVDQTSSIDATSVGTGALTSNSGTGNTAVGYESLANPTGSANTATGFKSLNQNSSGGTNTAYGYQALQVNTSGSGNSALGSDALNQNSTGSHNTAVGTNSAAAMIAGNNNTALGDTSLGGLIDGSGNIALGYQAGNNLQIGSNNIDIGNAGNSDDGGVIRIGTAGNQGTTFIAGIYGATAASGSAVLITSSGLLGTLNSSIRFKEDVHDMADSTDALMQLRPVEFRYKQPAEDGTKPVQFGLIAEEVAKVYPELVVRGTDGQIDSVKYHELSPMLLNEIQKQHRTIEQLEADKAEQLQRINNLEAEMQKVRALLAGK